MLAQFLFDCPSWQNTIFEGRRFPTAPCHAQAANVTDRRAIDHCVVCARDGDATGLSETIFVHPMDTLKVRMQTLRLVSPVLALPPLPVAGSIVTSIPRVTVSDRTHSPRCTTLKLGAAKEHVHPRSSRTPRLPQLWPLPGATCCFSLCLTHRLSLSLDAVLAHTSDDTSDFVQPRRAADHRGVL